MTNEEKRILTATFSKGRAAAAEETIKKGKYRVFNGTGYDTVHLETVAEQVIESDAKKFVSQSEKATWNSKAEGNHNHDSVYAKIADTYDKSAVDAKLAEKADATHGHAATSIIADSTHRFVSDTEKTRWNNTFTKTETSEMVNGVSNAVSELEKSTTAAIEKVDADFKAADLVLDGKIANKAEKTFVNTELSKKADKLTTYSKEDVNSLLEAKADIATVNAELDKKAVKADVDSALELKADQATMTTELGKKADKTALEGKADAVHTHTAAQVTGLGTAATKDVGTGNGQIPVLDSNGKLAESVLPKIAINEVFTAVDTSAAMEIEMQVGDILVLEPAVLETIKDGAVTYEVGKPKSSLQLSNEYVEYLAAGKMTYLCISVTAETFEDKFRPLQSSGDSITDAEVQEALKKKLDVTAFESYKAEVTNNLNLKADKATTYTKSDVDGKLSKKVDAVSGKVLSTNDYTTAEKDKLAGIAAGANNYVHPTGDGNLHVPATSTTNNGKVLMAGSTAGSLSWTALNAGHVAETSSRKYVTAEQIAAWTAKADAVHSHSEYRLKSESMTTAETKAEIGKMKTIISTVQPGVGTQLAGAVWIEEIQ